MIVIKVGGSLYDLPDLRGRLAALLASLADPDRLLVPGGGPAADAVRAFDHTHGLGPVASHWLALRACQLNAHFLQALLPASIVPWPAPGSGLAILDPLAFTRADDGRAGALPCDWAAASDAVAARAAALGGAELLLLKSVTLPAGMSWREAAAAGHVDPLLPAIIEREGLRVRAVNLRETTPPPGPHLSRPGGAPVPPGEGERILRGPSGVQVG